MDTVTLWYSDFQWVIHPQEATLQQGEPSVRIVVLSEFEATKLNAVIDSLQNMGYEIPLVVTTPGFPKKLNKDKMERFKKRLIHLNYNPPVLIIMNSKILPSVLPGIESDIILTMKFSFRLPQSVLDIPRIGAINFHPSKLPRYRGPNPIGWQILNNEPFMGLTFHFMREEYDSGPIIAQDQIPITEKDDIRSLVDKMFPVIITRLLPKALRLVGDGYLGIEQNNDEVTHAPSFSETQRTIDWTRSTQAIIRLVRAAAFHGVVARTDKGSYRVFRCDPWLEKLHMSSQVGEEVTETQENGILIRTSDGCLIITEYEHIDS